MANFLGHSMALALTLKSSEIVVIFSLFDDVFSNSDCTWTGLHLKQCEHIIVAVKFKCTLFLFLGSILCAK